MANGKFIEKVTATTIPKCPKTDNVICQLDMFSAINRLSNLPIELIVYGR